MCVFCNIPDELKICENEYCYAIPDKHPVRKGHTLVIVKRHVEDYFQLSAEEVLAMQELSIQVKDHLERGHNSRGYKLLMNCGKEAGQTVFHFHLHIIPV